MRITITNKKNGEKASINRDVCANHPAWVHAQLGTKSETELQRHLDCLHVDDWYNSDGEHLGDDVDGVSLWRE